MLGNLGNVSDYLAGGGFGIDKQALIFLVAASLMMLLIPLIVSIIYISIHDKRMQTGATVTPIKADLKIKKAA